MNFPLYIAKRYSISTSKNNAINIINRIASVGIIIGALALFVVLSVFSGLKEFSLSFTNAIDPDLKLNSTLGKSILITPEQERQIKQIEGLVSYTKIIEERVRDIYICLDADALKNALNIAERFIGEGLNVYFVELQDQDASELGFKRITEIIENTDILTFERIMELRMGLLWT